MDFKQTLKSWKLQQYIEIFEEEGWDDVDDWNELIENDGEILTKDLKLKKGHKMKFIKNFKKMLSSKDDEKEEKKEIIKPKTPMIGSESFKNPKTKKPIAGFYVIPAVKASSDKKSPYYSNFNKRSMISSGKKHKVILVVGQTGAGKSTVLNSMVNYIYQIRYEDNFRYKLIVEKEKKGGQAVSQTDYVTSYQLPINGSRLNYQLTVVDTPGFGDTRGRDQDILIMKDIKLWFEKKLDTLDAVCFVIKATDSRLTFTQKYIFSSILDLFGNDIKNNIFALITFSDTSVPPALAALKEDKIPYKEHFKLNNSVFFKDPINKGNKNDKIFDKMYWEMGTKCFELLFDGLNTTRPTSLKLTRKVLKEREVIGMKIEILNKKLDIGLSQVEELEKQKKWIKAHEDEINANKADPYTERRKKWVTVNIGNSLVTTCKTCPNQTCHPGCSVSNKSDCWAMTNGKCRICNCPDWNHENRNYVWREEWYNVTKTKWDDAPDMKNRFDKAQANKSRAQNILDNIDRKLKATELFVQQCIEVVKNSINELSKIALNKNVLSTKDYIDKMIQIETKEKKHGWQQRVASLKKFKQETEVMEKINKNQFSFRKLIGW